MRARLCALAAAALSVGVAAAVTMLPGGPQAYSSALSAPVFAEIEAGGTVEVIVRGGSVGGAGVRLTVPYDCTYGELFSLAGVEDANGYDLSAPLSCEDAVFAEGRYVLYIVI